MTAYEKIYKCQACKSLIDRHGKGFECAFTLPDVLVFHNCVCYDCLIKPVCERMCEDFNLMKNEQNKEVTEPLKLM
jgi:hypothetical protein